MGASTVALRALLAVAAGLSATHAHPPTLTLGADRGDRALASGAAGLRGIELVRHVYAAAIAESARPGKAPRPLPKPMDYRPARQDKLFKAARDQIHSVYRAAHNATPTVGVDIQALRDLFIATGGSGWTRNHGWDVGRDPCAEGWFGVACQDGRVVSLQLPANNLKGHIPETVSNMEYLQALDLSSNVLTGGIPSAVFAMGSLYTLDFCFNMLQGTLPATFYSPALASINLSDNNLTGALPSSWNAGQLSVLDLSRNDFSGPLPATIGKLGNLYSLTLYSNAFNGEALSGVVTLPPEWSGLGQLQQIWLSANAVPFGELPDTWGGMRAMIDFQVSPLCGTLPFWLGHLPNLESLTFNDGYITGPVPDGICQAKLTTLWLSGNSLSGDLPGCVMQMPSLETLRIERNSLSGSLGSLGASSMLRELVGSRNNMTGILPPNLGSAPALEVIDFSFNQLNGSLPTSLSQLTGVVHTLYLSDDSLHEPIPASLEAFFKSLAPTLSCDLSNNPLPCPLPTWLTMCKATCKSA